jgi:lipopolysaccharide export system permease protein
LRLFTKFDIYVGKSYLKLLCLTLVLSVFLFTILDLIGKSNRYFTTYDPKIGYLILYYFFQIPFQVVQALPIASLVAAVVTMIGMSRNNESTAVFAVGMSPLRLLWPFVGTSLIICLFAIIANESIIPKSSTKMHYVKSIKIEKNSEGQAAGGVKKVRQGNIFYSYGEFDYITKTLKQVEAIEMDQVEFRISRQWNASSATFIPDENHWLLKGIRTVRFNSEAFVAGVNYRDFLVFPLPFKVDDLIKDRRDVNEYSFSELFSMIKSASSSGLIAAPLKVAFHVKLGYAFSSLVMVFMAIPFSQLSERKTDTVKSIMVVFAIAISYWFVLAASRALANSGAIPPFLGGWSSNIFLSIAGLLMYRHSKRRV